MTLELKYPKQTNAHQTNEKLTHAANKMAMNSRHKVFSRSGIYVISVIAIMAFVIDISLGCSGSTIEESTSTAYSEGNNESETVFTRHRHKHNNCDNFLIHVYRVFSINDILKGIKVKLNGKFFYCLCTGVAAVLLPLII